MSAADKFIVWDWNGTIVADEDAAFKAFNETLLFRNKPPLAMEAWREAFDMPLQQFYLNAGFRSEELDQHIMSMSEIFHKYFETFSAGSQLRKGWHEAMTVCGDRNFDNVILSNHLAPNIRRDAMRLGIVNECDHILAHANMAEQLSKQPKCERLRAHMKKYNLYSNQAVIVGDTPEEAHIGHQLGIPSVLITGGYATQQRLRAAKPDYLIDSMDELHPILQERGFIS